MDVTITDITEIVAWLRICSLD